MCAEGRAYLDAVEYAERDRLHDIQATLPVGARAFGTATQLQHQAEQLVRDLKAILLPEAETAAAT